MWGALPPAFLKVFPGPRGRPDLKNAPLKIRPDCLQVPSSDVPPAYLGDLTEAGQAGQAGFS